VKPVQDDKVPIQGGPKEFLSLWGKGGIGVTNGNPGDKPGV